MIRPSFARVCVVLVGLASAGLTSCATIPPDQIAHRCEQAAQAGATFEVIYVSLVAAGLVREKARAYAEAIRLGRALLGANCAILVR